MKVIKVRLELNVPDDFLVDWLPESLTLDRHMSVGVIPLLFGGVHGRPAEDGELWPALQWPTAPK